jgi:ATP-dependent DNA helicase RecG
MTLAELGRKSVRRNALVADLLHRIDFIEKAGTGIKRIRDDMRAQGCPEPDFEVNGFFTAIFRPNPGIRARAETRVGAQSGAQSVQALMALSNGDKSAREVAEAIGLRSKTGALKRTLNELLAGGLIEYTLPEKPSSRLQRYRLTRAGLEYLKKIEETK